MILSIGIDSFVVVKCLRGALNLAITGRSHKFLIVSGVKTLFEIAVVV